MLTAEQREHRKHHIGSSDTAAILGLDPFRNAGDVYAEKVLGLSKPAQEWMDLGNAIEGYLLDRFERESGDKLHRDAMRVHENGILCANHDALIIGVAEGVEAKTSGILYPTLEAWGEPGTDEVPKRVLIQCHHQMIVSKLKRVWVTAQIGGRGYAVYEVIRNDDLCQIITRAVNNFWSAHVLPKIPPPNLPPDLELVKTIRNRPGAVAEVPAEIVQAWLAAKDQFKEAEKSKDEAESQLRMCIGEAETAQSSIGTVQRQVRDRKAYTVAAGSYEVLIYRDPAGAQKPRQKKKGVAA